MGRRLIIKESPQINFAGQSVLEEFHDFSYFSDTTCKDTKIKIAYGTQNTIQSIAHKQINTAGGGIYQMKCLNCPLKYMGQIGRAFNPYTKNIYKP
jgi:hypothetical protein